MAFLKKEAGALRVILLRGVHAHLDLQTTHWPIAELLTLPYFVSRAMIGCALTRIHSGFGCSL